MVLVLIHYHVSTTDEDEDSMGDLYLEYSEDEFDQSVSSTWSNWEFQFTGVI